jgi:hypothetical protein
MCVAASRQLLACALPVRCADAARSKGRANLGILGRPHLHPQGYGERLVLDGRLNLAARTAALVEGENDPRCLLLAFACVRAACAVYGSPSCGRHRGEFEAEAAELFEVAVEPYFPVRFTPKKGDPQAITRRQLADAVAGCMAAAPEFAGLALPLLAEKLGSTLRCVDLGTHM